MRRLPVIQPNPLPPLYAAWMDRMLAGPIPRETDATCDDIIPSPSIQPQKIDPLALDGLVDEASQRKLWGNWADREGDFYRECARLVEQLSWKDVLIIGGSDLKILAQLVLEAYARLKSKRIPERLRIGSFQIISMNDERSRIVTHSALDPFDLPSRLLEALCYFDGRPTEEAPKTIAAERGIKLEAFGSEDD